MLQEVTLTLEYKFADGFLVRGEFRRDWSNERFFTGPRPAICATTRTPRSSAWCGGSATSRERGSAMADVIFVGVSVLFFVVGAAYVAGCRRLQ